MAFFRVDVPGFQRNALIQSIAKAGMEDEKLIGLYRYARLKGNTLFFVFNHPLAKTEFEYAKERILKRMRLFYGTNKTALRREGITFTQIHSVVVFPPKIVSKQQTQVPFYKERATGEFRNTLPGKLGETMEKIRESIKKENT